MRTLHRYIKNITAFVEIIISIIVLIGLALAVFSLVKELITIINGDGTFSHFLSVAFNLIIGVEFLEMLNNHSPGSALEVFLFAIVRHMVIEGGSSFDMLAGVLAVGLIFVIRRYFYVPSFEDDSEGNSQ